MPESREMTREELVEALDAATARADSFNDAMEQAAAIIGSEFRNAGVIEAALKWQAQKIAAAENDAAALREALVDARDSIYRTAMFDWATASQYARQDKTQEEYGASFCTSYDAALRSGAGGRVAEVLAKVRDLREWYPAGIKRGAKPRGMFDDSSEIEWDRRLDALFAVLDALDKGER